MAKLETQHIFQGNLEKVFEAITSYELYSEYLPGVTGVEILETLDDGSKRVKFDLNLMKKFHYTLIMRAQSPGAISWELESSNLMKSNSGSWDLAAKGKDKTVADYAVDITFKGLVPKSITDRVAKANIGGMFQGFQEIINAESGS